MLAAAAHRGVEVVDAAGAENLIQPVGARGLAPGVFGSVVGHGARHAGVVGGLVVGVGLLGGVQRLGALVGALPALVGVDGDAGRPALAALGGDDDNARRGLRPVDGGGGGVLQHRHAGNVVGVDGRAEVRHAIDHVQRLLVVNRARAPDNHPRRGRGVAAGGQHRHAGHVALQHAFYVGNGAVGLLGGVGQGSHGGSQVVALGGAVAGHEHLVEARGGCPQQQIKTRRLVAHGYFHALEADEGQRQHGLHGVGHAQLKDAFRVGRRAGAGTFHEHRHAGQGLAGLVGYFAADGALGLRGLGQGVGRQAQYQRGRASQAQGEGRRGRAVFGGAILG